MKLDKVIYECEKWGVVVAIESNDWEKLILQYLKNYRELLNKPLNVRLIDVLRDVRGEK